MNKKNLITSYLFSTMGILIMLIIAVAVYVIAGVVKVRLDLTQDKLYTLSPGTRAILKKLDTPVEINFYCSQSSSAMPVFMKTYAQQVEDLLTEIQKNSHGMIDIKKFDPQPDSDAEEKASFDTVEGQMIQTGDKIYLGLCINCLDAKVALPFLSPEREKLLEYDVMRAISRAMTPTKPTIGVMSGLPVFGGMNPAMMQMGQRQQQPAWTFLSELKRDFEVKQLELTADKIDEDVKVLVVIHPRDISLKTQYALDQFVLRGGKLLAFLDPLSIVDSRGGNNPMQRTQSTSSTFEALLKVWGLTFDTSKVVADMTFVSRINRGQRPEAMPSVLSLTQQGIETNDVVTSQIDSLLMLFAGTFSGTPAEGLKETVLLKTSKNSQLVDKMLAELSGEQTAKDFKSGDKELPIAVRLTGKFKTAFPEGKPKEEKKEDPAAAKDDKETTEVGLKESKTDGVVVLVGDCDMLFDAYSVRVQEIFGQRLVQPMNGNLTLLQNLVEQLAGDNNLIGVRGRATMIRPFTVVSDLKAKAEKSFAEKISSLEKSLTEAQQRVNELQVQKKEAGQRLFLSAEQQKELQNFREKERAVKKELKDVRKNLRREIDSLETSLQWINIAGMPVIVVFAGVFMAFFKRSKTSAK